VSRTFQWLSGTHTISRNSHCYEACKAASTRATNFSRCRVKENIPKRFKADCENGAPVSAESAGWTSHPHRNGLGEFTEPRRRGGRLGAPGAELFEAAGVPGLTGPQRPPVFGNPLVKLAR
jgi:hypothetical protein